MAIILSGDFRSSWPLKRVSENQPRAKPRGPTLSIQLESRPWLCRPAKKGLTIPGRQSNHLSTMNFSNRLVVAKFIGPGVHSEVCCQANNPQCAVGPPKQDRLARGTHSECTGGNMTTIRPPGRRTDGFAARGPFARKIRWERLARGRPPRSQIPPRGFGDRPQ